MGLPGAYPHRLTSTDRIPQEGFHWGTGAEVRVEPEF